jgi:SAM-dependent methyltransferase
MGFLKGILEKMWENVWTDNESNIQKLLDPDTNAVYLDLGCDDGYKTVFRGAKIGTSDINGIEVVEERMVLAKGKNVKVKESDLNEFFPYEDESISAITANQVIEHLYDTDKFISEIYRILKKDGYAIISTENASSWHNIIALMMGFQMFSLTNISNKKTGIGNPFALHKNETTLSSSWQHLRIFSYQGLIDIFKTHGFTVREIIGAGYFPLFKFLSKIDCRHSSVLTIKVVKT